MVEREGMDDFLDEYEEEDDEDFLDDYEDGWPDVEERSGDLQSLAWAGVIVLVFLGLFAVVVVQGIKNVEEKRIKTDQCEALCAPHPLHPKKPWDEEGRCRCDVGVELR